MHVTHQKRKCNTLRCHRVPRRHHKACATCEKKAWRLRNPIAYIYDNLRTHARGRGIEFGISIADFKTFCWVTRYHELKGTDPESATIDRVRPEEGYNAGNLRVLTHLANSTRRALPPTRADLDEAVQI